MPARTPLLVRFCCAGLLNGALLFCPAWFETTLAQGPSRDRKIAELQEQIQALAKQLEELKKPEATAAAAKVLLSSEWTKKLAWRSIGPAAMGGRIVDLAVFEDDPSTYFVATASGGLLKTSNNGVTFEHQFDRENTVSIGAVCVAPSNRDIVWVGTGENNPRNSVSYGDGVYKSTDGGKTWKNMGLTKSFQIGRIVIHPTNPDVVYVGALGRLYGPNEERGVFKTSDGGQTWQKVLYVDDKTGVIDMRMHPQDPNTLLVAAYERQRDGFDTNEPAKEYAPGSGLYKTTDGGSTFKKITAGLPTCNLGRIGLDYYRKDPNVVLMILSSEKTGKGPAQPQSSDAYMGMSGDDAPGGARLNQVTRGGPSEAAGLREGDVITAVDDKQIKTYQDLVDLIRVHKPQDKVKVKLTRGEEAMEVELTYGVRTAGSNPFSSGLGGQRENVQDRQTPDGHEYGGVYRSADGGESWTRVNSLNPRPMYFSQIRVDPTDEKFVYVLGISLYRSVDGGKTFRPDGGRSAHADHHALWIDPDDGRHMVLGCDGGFYATYDRMDNWDHLNHLALGQFYHVALDPRPLYRVYGGLQDNGTWGGPTHTKAATGPINEDWIRVGGGDGFVCRVDPNDPDLVYYESQNGGFSRRNLRTGEAASLRPRAPEGKRYRFNWNSPFILSSHNSKIYYNAGNFVFRSLDRGNNPRVISPEITLTDRGSATALAESPRNPDVLYVGTDDGALWVTRNGGGEWTNITDKVGLPGPRWVATIEASRFAEGRAYVAFDGHRSDDDDPHVYVTEDFGQTWKSLRANLPWGSTRVLREDIVNENLLFLGTEFAAWASIDRGQSWAKLNHTLPTVAVHEFAIHPSTGEVVVATHGRSLWVFDATPLRQMNSDVLAAKVHLYQPGAAFRWHANPVRGGTNRRFVGSNPARGAQLYYSLSEKPKQISLKIVDYQGETVRQLRPAAEPGLHQVAWDMTRAVRRERGARGEGEATRGEGRGASQQSRTESETDQPATTPAAGARETSTAPARGEGTPEAPTTAPPGRGEGTPEAPATTQPAPAAAGSSRPITAGRGPGADRGTPVSPGMYRLVLTVDGKDYTQSLELEIDPTAPADAVFTELEEEDEEERERELEGVILDD